MSLWITTYVLCDECGLRAPVADGAKEARAAAKREGWEINPGSVADLCPRCRHSVACEQWMRQVPGQRGCICDVGQSVVPDDY